MWRFSIWRYPKSMASSWHYACGSPPQMQSACLIALSGYGSETDIEAARQAGFNHHLLKPIQLSQLTPLLEQTGDRSSNVSRQETTLDG
jgi:AmiR/NasT family two-component response regulator